jgi:hypothetical protein
VTKEYQQVKFITERERKIMEWNHARYRATEREDSIVRRPFRLDVNNVDEALEGIRTKGRR